MSEHIITSDCDCWGEVSDLIGLSISNAAVSCLGRKFGAYYYRKLAEPEHSCVFVCKHKDGKFIGVIIGTTNLNAGGIFSFFDKVKLLALANIMLFRPVFVKWVVKGILAKIMKSDKPSYVLDAELLDIAVNERYRGCGIAQELVGKMESFFVERGVDKYLIKTEKANLVSNRFYKKIGAEFVATYKFHGREINKFHKDISR